MGELRAAIEHILRNGSTYHDAGSIIAALRAALEAETEDERDVVAAFLAGVPDGGLPDRIGDHYRVVTVCGHCGEVWSNLAVVPDCHCQHVTGGRCMFAASPPKPEPLTPERLAAIGKVSYEPTIDQLAIKGRIARGAADYEGFLMAMSPYVRVEESVREAHAGSRSADSSATPTPPKPDTREAG